MPQFKKYDVASLLGFTPLTRVTDAEIWAKFLTPQVRAALGDVVTIEGPHVLETVKGLFPGDEAYNLNNHRMYGGQSTETVRFPYIELIYHTEYGSLVIKRDAVKIKTLGFYGKVQSGKAQLIYESALRDRRYDGKCRANDTALTRFPYDDSNFNQPIPYGIGVELSIYGFQPGTRVTDLFGKSEAEYQRFLGAPFTFLNEPEKFVKHFERAWTGGLGPGQIAPAIHDVARKIVQQFESVAKKAGYDFLEGCASHYHVAQAQLARGFRYTYEHDAATLSAFGEGIKQIKAAGTELTRPQESWLCVVQSLRPVELIPKGLYLSGPEWPQNNIDQKNLWLSKPLNDKAKAAVPGLLKLA